MEHNLYSTWNLITLRTSSDPHLSNLISLFGYQSQVNDNMRTLSKLFEEVNYRKSSSEEAWLCLKKLKLFDQYGRREYWEFILSNQYTQGWIDGSGTYNKPPAILLRVLLNYSTATTQQQLLCALPYNHTPENWSAQHMVSRVTQIFVCTILKARRMKWDKWKLNKCVGRRDFNNLDNKLASSVSCHSLHNQ